MANQEGRSIRNKPVEGDMRMWRMAGGALVSAALIAIAFAVAADFPERKTSEYVIKNFTFPPARSCRR
jgi:hypothetical protein